LAPKATKFGKITQTTWSLHEQCRRAVKSSRLCDFHWYFSSVCKFLYELLTTVKQ